MNSQMRLGTVLAVLTLWLMNLATAQTDIPDSHIPQTDQAVFALARAGNMVYVGGTFTEIGGVSRNCLAAFDAGTGTVDPDWDPDITGSGGFGIAPVEALLVVGDRLYVGGAFNTVNGSVTRNNLAAFELAGGGNTGTVDAAWDPDITTIGGAPPISDLATVGSRVIAGGFFNTVNGGVTRNDLASFPLADGSTAATADSWDPNVLGYVFSLAAEGNIVYVGGTFTMVNGSVPRANLAAFDATTGVVDAAWDPDIGGSLTPIVSAIELDGTRIYAAGDFATVNGSVSRDWLAAFEPANGSNTGAVDASWDSPLTPDVAAINDLAVLNSRLFVGGHFPVSGSATPSSLIAVSRADGSTPATIDLTWDAELAGNIGILAHFRPIVIDLLPFGDGLIVGGNFQQVQGETHFCLAGFDIEALPTAVEGAMQYR